MAWKNSLMLVFVVLATLTFALADNSEESGESYTSKYDNIDVEAILANPKLRNQYLNCYMETAPCVTADAKFMKDKFAEAFVTKCKKCSEKQVQIFDRITAWYTENEPDTWKKVVEKALNDIKQKKGSSDRK